MGQVKLSRRVVLAIGAVFGLLLCLGFWGKLNPRSGQKMERYYQDAARLEAEESGLQAAGEKRPGGAAPPPGVPSDKAYQPESGNID